MLAVAEELAGVGALWFFPVTGWEGDGSRLRSLGVDVVTEPLDAHLARPEVGYDAVVISRPQNHQRWAEEVRRLQPGAALVYDAEALFHRRMFLQAAVTGDADVAAAAAATRAVEERIACDVDRVVCISDDEAALLAAVPGHAPISVIPPRRIAGGLTPAALEQRRDLLLAAAWLHVGPESPNLDGLLWFAAEVLPRVCRAVPGARLLVTGGNPPPAARAVAGPNLEFLGHVDDLGAVYARARVVVVPVRFGSGVKNKTVEALLRGVPAVATGIGAEGLGVRPEGALAVADQPDAMAAAIVRLLTDDSAWRRQRGDIETLLDTWARTPTTSWAEVIHGAVDDRRRRGEPSRPALVRRTLAALRRRGGTTRQV